MPDHAVMALTPRWWCRGTSRAQGDCATHLGRACRSVQPTLWPPRTASIAAITNVPTLTSTPDQQDGTGDPAQRRVHRAGSTRRHTLSPTTARPASATAVTHWWAMADWATTSGMSPAHVA